MSARDFVHLNVSYVRLTAEDQSGVVDITSEGAEDWVYGCIGSYHGLQGEGDGTDERVMEFGAKLAALVREHYGPIAPLLATAPAPQGGEREG